jgi:preprotein translocase subunit SecE
VDVASVKKFRGFLDEVWGELKRTSWPSQQEVTGTTLVVIITVVLIAFFLYVVDVALGGISGLVFGLGG